MRFFLGGFAAAEVETADPSTAPNFLSSPMGSTKLMRLSLMKAAH
jgi:hypothetical protein